MPTVTLNKEVFERLVGKKLPLEELKERISMLGTDLENIENNDITVEIFPNRPDLLSEQGLARAFSSFIGVKTGLREYKVKKSGYKVIIDKSVTMRPYTACAVVKSLTFDDEKIREIMQVQEKLATTHGRNRKKSAYGIYPLQQISFPINYIAKDPQKIKFKPLGFDKEIIAAEIINVHPKGQAFKNLTKDWKEYPFFIDSKNKVMCMLPFTNSEDTGKVTEKTTEVFVECTGIDWENVNLALNMIVTALADLGGEIYSLEMIYPDRSVTTPDLFPRKMKLNLKFVNALLGLDLVEHQAQELLARMGYGYEQGEVLIPAYRTDILHQADLAEDIAIAYGYENFQEEIPKVATIGEENILEIFSRKVRGSLIGMQLLEAKNYHLITGEFLNERMLQKNEIIPLINVIGDHNHLRNSLLPGLLKNLAENLHNESPQNLFEIGRIFNRNHHSDTGVSETEHLGLVLCHDKTDFTELKQVLESLLAALGLEFSITETVNQSFIPGRVGEIFVKEKSIGLLGEVHPQVLDNWQINSPVVALEIDLEMLFKILKN